MDKYSHLMYPKINLNNHTLDDNLPPLQAQPQNNSLDPPPTASLGALDRLPTELLQEILIQLDLSTFMTFRCTNRRAKEFADHLPQYKAITTNARNALRGILRIGTSRWITCKSLFENLRTSACEQCGDFGGYLYILTCRRVCFVCFTQDKRYLPLRPNEACRRFGLKRAIIQTLPCMRVIPGIYSPNEKKATKTTLVDYESAFDAGIARHGSLGAMDEFVAGVAAKKLQAYGRRVIQAQQSGSSRRTRMPPLVDPFDASSGNPLRFVAIVRVPWLNRTSQDGVEWGFYCVGCARSIDFPLHWRRQFTPASFDQHMIQCGDIINGRHQAA
ncbi:F-box domain-containing protein [Metarhizium guizhouense ARSEF 977]|uniref:F-box domain-containing protein n=1 Tax=Metarhizium guizhouense (strain ARSEF 977) TaxID=1276136 RepID=A0A0B4H8P8_METGA|nr:F-box domain-containing protein [Metarhizium guizhouense ARSEF 977]